MKKAIHSKQESDFDFVKAYLLMLGVRYYADFMQYLTKYPPFSFFWKDRFFHFDNRDIRDSREKINEITKGLVQYFDVSGVERNQYFLTLYGKFSYRNKKIRVKNAREIIKEKLEKEDMTLYPYKKDFIKILVKRKA